jgi:hypothetical protein
LQSTLSTLQIGQTTISIPRVQASSVVSNLGIAAQSVNKSIITQATSGTDPNSMSSSGNPPQLIEAQTTNIPPDQIDGLADYQKVNPDTGQIYYGAPPLDPKELGASNTSTVGNSNVEAQQTIAQDEIANQTSIVRVLTDSSMLPGPAISSEPVPWNPDEGGAPNPDVVDSETSVPQIEIDTQDDPELDNQPEDDYSDLSFPEDIDTEDDPELDNQPEDDYSDLSFPEDIDTEDDPELLAEEDPEDDYSNLDSPPDINEDEDPELGYQSSVYNGPVTQSPPQIPLPMGTAISDIYDPNLTPEQVASLQPNEQQLRAEELGYTYTGPAVTGLATENPDGSLTVTAKAQATAQDQSDYASQQDWRVRLKLAPGSNYLYNAPNPGILGPLASKGGTDGVIFPYTPGINITYSADYQSENLTHTNYTINQYKASHVDAITITAEFTAQDVFEANYLLAVIHFFKSATKMFYGQDSNPKNGTPPPLCYLFGYGGWQFDNHPLAIQQFSYNLPPDVDYIRTTGPSAAGTVQPTVKNNTTNGSGGAASRLPPNINPGGTAPPPNFPNTPASANVPNTWVPTKIQMSITCVPIISRNNVSNIFSLQDYAAGSLTPAVNKNVNTGFW